MKQKLIAPMLALSCLFLPLTAQANPVNVPKAGLGVAGMIEFLGQKHAYFAVQPWDGSTCLFYFMGTGAMQGNYFFRGTPEMDWWTFSSGTVNHCGYSMTPLSQNGYYISLYGAGSGDVMFGGYGPNSIYGQDGNDGLAGAVHSVNWTSGGADNDTLKGAQLSSDNLSGEEGNDALCEFAGTKAFVMNGGDHTDSRCGTATTITSVESVNCAVCGW